MNSYETRVLVGKWAIHVSSQEVIECVFSESRWNDPDPDICLDILLGLERDIDQIPSWLLQRVWCELEHWAATGYSHDLADMFVHVAVGFAKRTSDGWVYLRSGAKVVVHVEEVGWPARLDLLSGILQRTSIKFVQFEDDLFDHIRNGLCKLFFDDEVL